VSKLTQDFRPKPAKACICSTLKKEKELWHPGKSVKEISEKMKKWNSLIGLFSLSSQTGNILIYPHYFKKN
jgi:hypothetical protein